MATHNQEIILPRLYFHFGDNKIVGMTMDDLEGGAFSNMSCTLYIYDPTDVLILTRTVTPDLSVAGRLELESLVRADTSVNSGVMTVSGDYNSYYEVVYNSTGEKVRTKIPITVYEVPS